jgi:hypothetical protein
VRSSFLHHLVQRWARLAVLVGLSTVLGGCATIGHEFAVSEVDQIVIGQTTMEDVKRLFGNPWRTGVEDGRTTWTYGHYRYSIFGRAKTRDLVLRFDENNVVASYSFNTTEPEDRQPSAQTGDTPPTP